jgi:hypothetical protein
MHDPAAWRGCERLAKVVQGPVCVRREVRRPLRRLAGLCEASRVPDGGLSAAKSAQKHVSVLLMHMGCCDAASGARLTLFFRDDVACSIIHCTPVVPITFAFCQIRVP